MFLGNGDDCKAHPRKQADPSAAQLSDLLGRPLNGIAMRTDEPKTKLRINRGESLPKVQLLRNEQTYLIDRLNVSIALKHPSTAQVEI